MTSAPTLGYPTLTLAVLDLYSQGLTTAQIAQRVGRTARQVSSTLAQARWRQSCNRQTTPLPLTLDLAMYQQLLDAAHARGTKAPTLAERIITAVLTHDLITAVLED